MKVSEVTIQNLKEYCRVDGDSENIIFQTILTAVKSYIKSYTGLTDTQINEKEDLTIVLFVLANEMYENRQFTVANDKVNTVIKSILNMYSINLL